MASKTISDGYWTEQRIRELSVGCLYRKDLRKKSEYAYRQAGRLGILDELFPKKKGKGVKWTVEHITNMASTVTTITEFEQKFSRGCAVARELGILYDLFPRKHRPRSFWNFETLKLEAEGCDRKVDFKRKNSGAYRTAVSLGLIDVLFPESTRKQGYWNKGNVTIAAKSCNSCAEFYSLFRGAHGFASRNGMLDTLFEDRHRRDTSRPRCIYLIRADNPSQVYVGLTVNFNTRWHDKDQPHAHTLRARGTYVQVTEYLPVEQAQELERELIAMYQELPMWDCINKTKGGEI